MLSLRFASDILKRKKKKESHSSSGGFKKSQVFLKKYYPTVVLKKMVYCQKQGVVLKLQGWRFFQKPVGHELYFLKPELKFAFFFIFFNPQKVVVILFCNVVV